MLPATILSHHVYLAPVISRSFVACEPARSSDRDWTPPPFGGGADGGDASEHVADTNNRRRCLELERDHRPPRLLPCFPPGTSSILRPMFVLCAGSGDGTIILRPPSHACRRSRCCCFFVSCFSAPLRNSSPNSLLPVLPAPVPPLESSAHAGDTSLHQVWFTRATKNKQSRRTTWRRR